MNKIMFNKVAVIIMLFISFIFAPAIIFAQESAPPPPAPIAPSPTESQPSFQSQQPTGQQPIQPFPVQPVFPPQPNQPGQPNQPRPMQPLQQMPLQGEQGQPRDDMKQQQPFLQIQQEDAETQGYEGDRRDFVDPREIKDVLRQIKDLKKEANRLIKKAQKINLTSEASQINEILSQVVNLGTILSGKPEAIERDILQEFYDSQLWDRLNDIRIKIELPNEIKMIEKELKKLDKLMAKKGFAVEGIDMEKVKAKIETIRSAIGQAKNNLAQNNLEDAREDLQVIYEGAHPGEIMGVLQRLYEMTRQIKKMKSNEIKNDINEILAPVFEAVSSEDFREANMMLNEVDRELWRFIEIAKVKPAMNADLRSRIDKLEEKLQKKIEQEKRGGPESSKNKEVQSYSTYQRYYAASAMKTIYENVLEWLGL